MILLILISVPDLRAAHPPKTLKAYFESFSSKTSVSKNDTWFGSDKGYHVIGSLMSTTLVANISMRGFDQPRGRSQMIGLSVTAGLGIIKEYYDAKEPNNRFSWKDLAADGLGIIIGVLILGIH